MDRIKKYLGLTGIISPTIGILTLLSSISLQNWFSWTENALSDLGAVGISNAYVYNYGLIIAAIFGIIFSLNLFAFLKYKISRAGTIFFLLGLIFLITVAIYPSGTSPHVLVSFAFFGFSAFGIFLIGIGESVKNRKLGYLCLGLILIGLPLAYVSARIFSGVAIPEMIGVICFSIFSFLFSLKIYTENVPFNG